MEAGMPDETNKRQSGHHTGLSQAHDQVQELRMGIYIQIQTDMLTLHFTPPYHTLLKNFKVL